MLWSLPALTMCNFRIISTVGSHEKREVWVEHTDSVMACLAPQDSGAGPLSTLKVGTSCIKVNKADLRMKTLSEHLNHSGGDPIDPKGTVQKRAQKDRDRIRGLKRRVLEEIPPNENAGKSRDWYVKRGCTACQVNLCMMSNCWSKFHKV